MKLFTLALLFVVTTASAQWSNTTNLFYDSLHTAVCNAAQTQMYTLVVRSYPDSGYFVIWQDYRYDPSGYNDNGRIYAQKYDKAGNRLWAVNGVNISAGTSNQHYAPGKQDYRSYSYAATDSAGGFYIAYADDSVTNVTYERACLQHMKSDGSPVFSGPGYIFGATPAAGTHVGTQLIADGAGGCFVAFTLTTSVLHAYDYKDVNGTLQNLGGGIMNENATQVTETSPCGNYSDLTYADANVTDYNIYSDLQGGCNFIMSLDVSGTGKMIAYNKLWRAKQNATATQYVRDLDFSALAQPTNYQKGNVYRLFYLITDHQEISCGSNPNVYTVNQYRLVQNGFQEIDGGAAFYDVAYPKGVTVTTTGNINAGMLIGCVRSYSSANGASAPITKGYAMKEEVFDSIPYQRTSSTDPDYPGYNTAEPPSLAKLAAFRDTLLSGNGGGVFEASLGGGSNQLFTAGLIGEDDLPAFYRNMRLQHLAVESAGPDSFAVVYKTNTKQGVIIGQCGAASPAGNSYDLPFIAVNNNGVGLFYVIESLGSSSGSARVSPIFNGAELAWGAMGKPIGTGYFNGNYYTVGHEQVSLDPTNGTAVVAWSDNRNAPGNDIYMRHLDRLNDLNYQPPYTRVRALSNPYGTKSSQVLNGTSNQFSTFEANATNNNADPGFTPVAAISDNYNLGNVTVGIYENTSGIRTYNGTPYLDRSWTITPDNNPNGAATVTILLFFTTDEFNALKAADPTITSPGDLAVVKQPSGSGSGSTYSLVAGEKTILPQSWAAVDGGYYIEIQITSFSNFFIFKKTNPLPLNWLGVQAQWQNAAQAKVDWQVAEQQSVKTYTVQHSADGNLFTDACTVPADSAETAYSCIVDAGNDKNYYRVVETDYDGLKNYSKVVLLQDARQGLTMYPNPAKDVLYVQGLGNYKTIQIADANGNILQRQIVVSDKQSIDIHNFTPGIYILTLTGNSESKTVRFIKI